MINPDPVRLLSRARGVANRWQETASAPRRRMQYFSRTIPDGNRRATACASGYRVQ